MSIFKLKPTQITCPDCGELCKIINGEIAPHGDCSSTAVDETPAQWIRSGQPTRDTGSWIRGRKR